MLNVLLARRRDPFPCPRYGGQFHVADVARQEDHALDLAFVKPLQTKLALLLHPIHSHLLVVSVVEQVAPQQDRFGVHDSTEVLEVALHRLHPGLSLVAPAQVDAVVSPGRVRPDPQPIQDG